MRKKTIIFVHGRNFKPPKRAYRSLWYDAIGHGLERDFGEDSKKLFKKVNKRFAYYGELSNEILTGMGCEKDDKDSAYRKASLSKLKKYTKDDFLNEAIYKNMCGLLDPNKCKEFFADVFGGVVSKIHLGDNLITWLAPDMEYYWHPEEYYGSDVRAEMLKYLKPALKRNEDIMIISHSLGTLITYDNLWKLSHYGEYRHDFGSKKKVNLWLTLGSPLGDETVKSHLKGSISKMAKRYPHNIERWVNIAAEDDYVAHDSEIKDDYAKMKQEYNLITKLKDYKIKNLATYNGKPNQHSSIGYLIHPTTIEIIHKWLNDEPIE